MKKSSKIELPGRLESQPLLHVCVHIYICTHTHIYIYIYMYTHTNAYLGFHVEPTSLPEQVLLDAPGPSLGNWTVLGAPGPSMGPLNFFGDFGTQRRAPRRLETEAGLGDVMSGRASEPRTTKTIMVAGIPIWAASRVPTPTTIPKAPCSFMIHTWA